MKTAIAVLLVLPLGTFAGADTQTDREKLEGTWVQQANANPDGWTIARSPAGLHITQVEDGRPTADFECNITGRDCEVKVQGHKATVSMYYNGPALVLLETRNDKVVKRRFSAMPTGDAMKLEVIPMSGGAQEEIRYQRQNATEAHK